MRDDNHASGAGTISIAREFDAPRARVFRQWIDPLEMRTWFAPDGFTITACEADPRPGGAWRVTFRSEAGVEHSEYGEFIEVQPPARLSFTLTQATADGRSGPTTTVVVSFTEMAGRTRMQFHQSGYASTTMRDGNAEGWSECFNTLRQRLEGERA